jgi:hypothetical protein
VQLRLNAERAIKHKSLIDTHLCQVEEDNNSQVLQIAFNCLKERVVLKKFKYISYNCYRLRTVKKYFFALQENFLKK